MKNQKIKYEMILVFDRFKGLTVAEIAKRLKSNCTVATAYRYKQRYIRADRKMRELTKNW